MTVQRDANVGWDFETGAEGASVAAVAAFIESILASAESLDRHDACAAVGDERADLLESGAHAVSRRARSEAKSHVSFDAVAAAQQDVRAVRVFEEPHA